MLLYYFLRSARWSSLTLIIIIVLLVGTASVEAGPPGPVVNISGRKGFDKCWSLGISQMDDVSNLGPYWTVGIYFGGINVGTCKNNLTSGWVSHNGGVGWGFLPIYLGRFPSCFTPVGNHVLMSSNVATAISQANSAAKDAEVAANSFGFTVGTELYLDIEAYDINNSSCRSAANAYVSEWIRTLKADGYRAGAYGSSCQSAMNDWQAIASPPDDIYIGKWNNNTNVILGIDCINPAYWAHSKRHHQYDTNHVLTYGSANNEIVNEVCSQGHVAGTGYDDGVLDSCP